MKVNNISTKLSIFFAILSTVMLAASFMLVRDGYLLASNNTTPSCDINPFFSCGNIFTTWQAKILASTPNPVYGLIGYTVLLTVFIATLQGAKFKPWFWRVFTAGIVFAWVFLMWLFYQSVFNIGFLCLYCMIVWVAHTLFLFIFMSFALKYNLLHINDKFARIGELTSPYVWVPIVLVLTIMVISIRLQFPLLFI